MKFVRINKNKARKYYNKNKKNLYILPCKIYPCFNNKWIQPINIVKSGSYNGDPDLDFDNRINAYTFFNCNYELGYYLSYYVLEGD